MSTLALSSGPASQRRCALYRHYDDSDVLLYVGITESLGDRTNSGHARTSDWVQFAARAEAEWHDSRELASAAEREAVRDETPVFNRQYAEGDVDRQIMEYLHAREVRDLNRKLSSYFEAVQRFLSVATPEDVAEGSRRAREDFSFTGQDVRDVTFYAHVLRHIADAVGDRTTDIEDGAGADAYAAVIAFAVARVEAIRDRRQQAKEPIF